MRPKRTIAILPLDTKPGPWPSTPLIYDRCSLREKGWTLTLIRRHLAHCEFRVASGYYDDKTCYPAKDVLQAELTAGFKADLARMQARREAARAPRAVRCQPIIYWRHSKVPRIKLPDNLRDEPEEKGKPQ